MIVIGASPLSAQDQIDTAFLLPRAHHPWGRFEAGAWKKVRVTTETLNERGEVTGESVAETVTTLLSVDERGYSLKCDTTIIIGGRQLGTQVSTLWQGFAGEKIDDTVSSRLIRPASLRIGSRALDTEVREFTFRSGNMVRVTSIHYSPSTAPHVMEGHTVATDPSGRSVKYRTDIDVVSLNHDFKVLDETYKVAKVRTEHETPKSKVTTLELFAQEIPGGIVASESEERDLSGRIVSRSTLEVVEFGASDSPANRLFSGGRFFKKRRGR